MSSATVKQSSTKPITRREFFAAVRDHVHERVPGEFQGFRVQATHRQMKLYYRHYKLHYEVWTNGRDQHIEIGLHFEAGADVTEYLIRYFDRHILEIKHELGPEVELERWTNSWGRIYQLLPYQPLTEDLAVDVGNRLTDMIVHLQPLLDDATGELPNR
jgi:hypothetical protein